MTRLSVCIPTYNRPVELGNLLDSIPADIPVYVSDNGGTLTDEFRQKYAHVAIPHTGSETVPIFANWNRAARMSTAEWLLVPSDDDIYFPGAFDTIAAVIDGNPTADIVIFGHHIVGEHYEVLETWQPKAQAFRPPAGFELFKGGVQARMPSVAIRRTAMEQLGFFDEHFGLTAGDSDLVQRALLTCDAVFVPTVVSGYRVWQRGLTRLTLATPRWMAEIDHWGAKIEAMLRGIPMYASQARRVHDELYAANLLEGMRLLRRQNKFAEGRAHFRQCRFPRFARCKTRAKLLGEFAFAALR